MRVGVVWAEGGRRGFLVDFLFPGVLCAPYCALSWTSKNAERIMTALKGNKREGKLMCHTNRQQSAAEERVFFIVLG